MVSGLPPGREAETWMVGIDLRQRRDRQQRIGDRPTNRMPAIISEVPIG
jgi:hypothetical protein